MKAIYALYPQTVKTVGTHAFDKDGNEITLDEAAINAEIVRLNAEYAATQYQRDRVKAYPSIGDQLDMIYHAGLGGDVFQSAIKAIKDQFPKGAN